MKRGDSGLSLLLGVNKPPSFTSHDIVNTCRRVFGERRVGHGGTLDPFATGVLPVMVGPATRMAPLFEAGKKEYVACISFGKSTTTDDLTGTELGRAAIPLELADVNFATQILQEFTGTLEQIPPKYSAVKIDGVRAYTQARESLDFQIKPRKVEVYSAELLDVEANPNVTELFWRVKFTVGSGTYIRSLARDIGERVGCPAHLSALCRLSVGGITLENSLKVDELFEQKDACALDPCKVLPHLTYFLDSSHEGVVRNGAPIKFDESLVYEYVNGEPQMFEGEFKNDSKFLVSSPDEVLGVYTLDKSKHMLKAETIFSVGVSRCNHKL